MRSGELRHQLIIKSKTKVADGMGGFTDNYDTTFATVWGAVWPVSAKESINNMQVSGEITHRIRVRYLAGVTADMRIYHGSREFEIVQPPINKDERNIMLDILCKEDVT